MTIQEAYKKFLLKISKNDTSDSIRISPAEFVYIFNEQALVWLGEKIEGKASTDSINDIEELLIEDLELSTYKETKRHNDFVLPDDFNHFVSATAIAEKDNCERDIDVYNIKPKEKNIWLSDEMNKPSFEWEETIAIIASHTLQVYKTDFDIINVSLSYYRNPIKVDIAGYKNVDGTSSKTIHPDLSDQNVNEIINRCALEADTNYKNGEAFQLNQSRILTEK